MNKRQAAERLLTLLKNTDIPIRIIQKEMELFEDSPAIFFDPRYIVFKINLIKEKYADTTRV